MEQLDSDSGDGSFLHKTQSNINGGYAPVSVVDEYSNDNAERFSSSSTPPNFPRNSRGSLQDWVMRHVCARKSYLSVCSITVVLCLFIMSVIVFTLIATPEPTKAPLIQPPQDASTIAAFKSCSGNPLSTPSWYSALLEGDEEGRIDLFEQLEGYARLHRDIVSRPCAREQALFIPPDFKSGLGNTAMVFLGPLLKAMFLGRALILPDTNKMFTFFDYPMEMRASHLPAPFPALVKAFHAKTKDSGNYWLPQKTLCGFSHLTSGNAGNGPVEPGLLTLNDLEPGYIADDVINTNFLTLNKKISWLFPWFLTVGTDPVDEPLRQFVEKVQMAHRDAFGTIVRWLFRPKPLVRIKVNDFLSQHDIPDLVPDFSVHIRFHNPRTHFFPGKLLDAMWVWTNTLGKLQFNRLCEERNVRVYHVFAATDQAETFNLLQDGLQRWLVNKAKKDARCPSNISQYVNVFQQVVSKREGDGDPMESIIDMFAFARAKVMLGTTFSTFSGFAALFNPFPLQLSCSPDVFATCHFTDNFPYWHASKDSVGVNFIWNGHQLQPQHAACMDSAGLDLSFLGSSPIDLLHAHSPVPQVAPHRKSQSQELQHFVSIFPPLNLQPYSDNLHTLYFQWWRSPQFLHDLLNGRDTFSKNNLTQKYLVL